MTGLIHLFNAALTGCFDVLVWPFTTWAPIWPMLFFSLIAGVVMLWLFGKVSNQAAIKLIRDRIRGNLVGVRLFQNDIGVLLRLQATILLDTLRYMKLSLVPVVVMLGPVLLIMIQLNLRFELRPLASGETAVVKVQVYDATALREGVALEPPQGITIETPPVRIPSLNEVAWRIRADAPGHYALKVHVGDEVVEKDVVGGGLGRSVASANGKRPHQQLVVSRGGAARIVLGRRVFHSELPRT